MSVIHTVYNHYLSSYGNRRSSRFDSQKVQDTEALYDSFIKMSKDSPLYKIRDAGQSFQQAIDVKEYAGQLKSALTKYAPYGKELDHSMFLKTAAESSHEEIASACFTGQSDAMMLDDYTASDLTVEQLATPQVNSGNHLVPNSQSLKPGRYLFDLKSDSDIYEFQFNVPEDEKNLGILNRVASLVNNSTLKISAEIEKDSNGLAYLNLASQETGVTPERPLHFEISAQASASSIQALKVLGIDQVIQQPSNAVYQVDGEQFSSPSNTVQVNESFHVTFHSSMPSETVKIGFKSDEDAITESLSAIVDAFNNFFDVAKKYTSEGSSHRLVQELRQAAFENRDNLSKFGIAFDEDDTLTLNRNELNQYVESTTEDHVFSSLSNLKDSLYKKADSISYDPLRYTNRIIIAYKNPGRTFASPYVASKYSGILIDSYL